MVAVLQWIGPVRISDLRFLNFMKSRFWCFCVIGELRSFIFFIKSVINKSLQCR